MNTKGGKRACIPEFSSSFVVPSKRNRICTQQVFNTKKLTDLCAKFIAEKFPYQQVEEGLHLPHIPEPIQEKIVYWAFPRKEEDIALYSSVQTHIPSNEFSKQPYHAGSRLVDSGNVSDVLQIGFHLSGVVKDTQGICQQKKTFSHNVTVTFDRCKITSVSCTCSHRSVLWCSHVVALTLYRIRFASSVPIRPPISEAVLQLKTTQLQKLVLNLVNIHHRDILPSVQKLLDDLVKPDTELSRSHGIPDPTAGACLGTETSWYFDADIIRQEVKLGLAHGNTGKHINSLFNKVREMFNAKDDNAIRLLSVLTDAFVDHSTSSENQEKSMSDKARKLWDCLTSLWVCAVLSPKNTPSEKRKMLVLLEDWNERLFCPITFQLSDTEVGRRATPLSLAINACSWNMSFIKSDVIASAAYVDVLRCHGCEKEALEMAVQSAKLLLDEFENCSNSLEGMNNDDTGMSDGGWLGHSLDPVNIIFDTLNDDAASVSCQKSKTENLQLAISVALCGLSQRRYLPVSSFGQLRMSHREEQLLTQLECLDFDDDKLKCLLEQHCERLLSHSNSILNSTRQNGISPAHSFARFLFTKVLGENFDVAYQVGLRALPLTVSSDAEQQRVTVGEDSIVPSCHILSHLQSQQGELAATMLRSCCTYPFYLHAVLDDIITEVESPTHLYRLAKLTRSLVSNMSGPVLQDFLNGALKIGLQTIELTITSSSWERREMVRWLVSCAVSCGREAVERLMRCWTTLFTAQEVTRDVASVLTSRPVLCQLGLSEQCQDGFLSAVRSMVIEGSIRDPSSCALFALTLCENDQDSFDLACQIVTESSVRLNASKLFAIARYLESKEYFHRAFKVAMLAMKLVDIGSEDESHPAVCDILWGCSLACSLGKDELTQVMPIVVNCVRHPLLLSEIARRCVTSTTFGCHGKGKTSKLNYSKEPINRLLASAQQLFVQEVQNKLQNITPKQYLSFVHYLKKVKSSFTLTEDGKEQFQWLTDYIATSQRGKKKLIKLINERLNDIKAT